MSLATLFLFPFTLTLSGLYHDPVHHRALLQISRDWARRLILVVCEREARLQAAESFRGRDPPRFVCPECHEFGCSTPDGLDEHLANSSWHETHAALQVNVLIIAPRRPSSCAAK